MGIPPYLLGCPFLSLEFQAGETTPSGLAWKRVGPVLDVKCNLQPIVLWVVHSGLRVLRVVDPVNPLHFVAPRLARRKWETIPSVGCWN